MTRRAAVVGAGLCVLLLAFSACQPESSTPPEAASVLFPVQQDSLWGFINPRGDLVIEPRFDRAWRFSDGHALVRVDGQYGFIDSTGTLAVAPRFADAWHFSEGLAPVAQDSLWGFINRDGEVVVDPQFELPPGTLEENPSDPDYRRARVGGQYGYRNPEGTMVIPPRFEQAWYFSDGRARIRKDGQWGFINRDGDVVIEPQFERAWDFRDGLARVETSDGTVGYVTREGTMVWPSQ